MGGNESKPKPPPPPTADEVLMDMRMTAKRFESEANRAQREEQKLIEKARQAVSKNNEEGAQLYVTGAVQKKRESQNLRRTAQRMEALIVTIRMGTSGQEMVEQLNQIQPILYQQAQDIPLEQMMKDMNSFNSAMDQMNVNATVMGDMMNQNDPGLTNDLAVDGMLNNLKQEEMNKLNGLGGNQLIDFNELNNPQNLNTTQDQNSLNQLKK